MQISIFHKSLTDLTGAILLLNSLGFGLLSCWDSRLGAGKAMHVSSSFLVVKKKGTTGLKLSNLMNLGRKKSSSLDSPERSLETSSKWQQESLCRDLSQGWISVGRAG